MSILNGFKTFERYLKTPDGYQLYSERQLAKDVLMGDGKDSNNNIENNITQLSNPNLLINADFQVWQRGENFNFVSLGKYFYTADRWCFFSGGDNRKITCNKVADGLKFTCSHNANALTQWLERRLVAGENYVLSAKINGNIETLNITGGTDNESDYLAYYSDNLTHDTDRIIIKPQTTTTVSWVKLEKGSVATPFVARTYAEELMMCQRYYYILPYGQYIVGVASGNELFLNNDWVNNHMRDSRTIMSDLSGLSICLNGNPTLVSGVNVTYKYGAIAFLLPITLSTTYDSIYMYYNNEAGKVCIDAEIY